MVVVPLPNMGDGAPFGERPDGDDDDDNCGGGDDCCLGMLIPPPRPPLPSIVEGPGDVDVLGDCCCFVVSEVGILTPPRPLLAIDDVVVGGDVVDGGGGGGMLSVPRPLRGAVVIPRPIPRPADCCC